MGISPIQYRPWKGDRSAQNLRIYVILRSVFRHGLKSTGVKLILIIAFLLGYSFQFLFVPISEHEKLTAKDMSDNFNGIFLAIFAMLLAAVMTSDLISEDLASNSYVLYFSRAIKVRDYLVGKAGGALMVMSLLCVIPPTLLALVSMATQSGGDYGHSTTVVGRTFVAGTLAAVFFVPYGLMLSSFTKRKSYAAVGTFMSFFVLTIVAGIFSEYTSEWIVISPIESLNYTFDWIFGQTLPEYVEKDALGIFLASFIVIPAIVVYARVMRKAVGK